MGISTDRVDHINFKIFARESEVDLEPAIPMFHRWIQDAVLDELLIDVADYRHVPAGPGIMLIGHSSNYSLDLAFSQLGLLYNRKIPAAGSLRDKLQTAFTSTLKACALVEEDLGFSGKLSFDAGQCELFFNDRLLVPNTDEMWESLNPELDRFFQGLFGAGEFTLQRVGEARERMRVHVTAKKHIPITVLHERSTATFAKQ